MSPSNSNRSRELARARMARMRGRHAEQKRLGLIKPGTSPTFRKGALLDKCFLKAWAEFSTTERFAQSFIRMHFSQAQDFQAKNSSMIDYCVLVERGGRIWIVPVELKNWIVPQRLDAKRFRNKIGKKYEWFDEVEANIKDYWIPSFNFPGEDRAWELGNFKRVNLLILTEAVRFTEDIADQVYTHYRVERVNPVEQVSTTKQQAEIEETVIKQMVSILERVFYQ